MHYPVSKILFVALFICSGFWPASAQSRDQNFPTPVTSSEISGVIRARDIGDSRLTTYFYTFEGSQGDIFINIVSKNLSGDIDVFSADSLQPLTKIVLYADSAQTETGRLIYLRKPARMILRVQGRSPNDDPATFMIKFAGSFVASTAAKTDDEPAVEHGESKSGIKVNSVGTIVETPPRKVEKTEATPEEKNAVAAEESAKPELIESETKPKEKPTVRITPMPEVKTIFGSKPSPGEEAGKVTSPGSDESDPPAPKRKNRKAKAAASPAEKEEKAPDPLASIRLVIEMKDGEVIEHPMNEVARFTVDKGVLTVMTTDRKTIRYSILLVEKVTIK